MTIPKKKRKVKQKKRLQRKKRRILSAAKKRAKRGKIQRGKKSRLVSNTNPNKKRLVSNTNPNKKRLVSNTNAARIRQLENQVKALKQKIRRKAQPGELLSERSEAARRGWTTRRANIAKKAQLSVEGAGVVAQAVGLTGMSQEEADDLLKFADQFVKNKKQLSETFIRKLPEYLVKGNEILVDRKENQIMFRLIMADQITGNFEEVVDEITEQYDLEDSQIYDLWHGYSLEE